MMVLQGKGILAEMNFAVVPENYFAEVMIWEVGSAPEPVASMHLMRQAVAVAAGAVDIFVVAAAIAFP